MGRHANPDFIPLRIAVLTVSDRRTLATDTSGQLLAERVELAGHLLIEHQVVADNLYRLRAVVSHWIADQSVQVIMVNGGTGFTDGDNTPRAVLPLLDKVMEGFGELFRQLSYADIGTGALQSRALAGFANGTFVCCMPGSPSACSTAWDGILSQQLDSRTGPCNAVPHLKHNDKNQPACCGSRS